MLHFFFIFNYYNFINAFVINKYKYTLQLEICLFQSISNTYLFHYFFSIWQFIQRVFIFHYCFIDQSKDKCVLTYTNNFLQNIIGTTKYVSSFEQNNSTFNFFFDYRSTQSIQNAVIILQKQKSYLVVIRFCVVIL